jgi:hypothetical protein
MPARIDIEEGPNFSVPGQPVVDEADPALGRRAGYLAQARLEGLTDQPNGEDGAPLEPSSFRVRR